MVSSINIKRQEEIKEMLCSCEDCSDKNVYFKELRKKGEELKQDIQINRSLLFLNSIGNKERFTIINVLKEKDRCVCELEVILNKSQPSISHHLRRLESIGLIRGWKKGYFTYYCIVWEQLKKYIAILNEQFSFK